MAEVWSLWQKQNKKRPEELEEIVRLQAEDV